MQRIKKSGRTFQLENLCDFTKDEEVQDNSRPTTEPSPFRSKEKARSNGGIEEHAAKLTSPGSKEELTPNVITEESGSSLPNPESIQQQSNVGNKVNTKG